MKLNPIAKNQTELELDRITSLFSYETPICVWISGKGLFKTSATFSQTTSRHVNGYNPLKTPTMAQSEIEGLLERNGK